MEQKIQSFAQMYEVKKSHRSAKARHDFLSLHEDANEMIITLNELVAKHLFFLENRTLSNVENGEYYSKLIVSFTRTHFLMYDLIISSDLIDSSVLFRKQLELMSRLVELSNNSNISRLIRKTPNVKHLEFDLNKLYTDYSEVAHSSAPDKMELLGRNLDEGALSIYPEFDENSYVSFRHLFLLVTQYHYWITEQYTTWFSDYCKEEDCKLFTRCYEAFRRIYYSHSKISKIGKSKK